MTDLFATIKVRPTRPPSPIISFGSPNLPTSKVTPDSVIDLTDSPEQSTPVVPNGRNYSANTVMVNPYKASVKNPYQKRAISSSPTPPQRTTSQFIGGAEAARRRAVQQLKRKSSSSSLSMKNGKATRILRPGEQLSDLTDEATKKRHVLSKYMNTFERFFAALFRSSVEEYRASASSTKLWETLCQRVDVTLPTQPVDARYADLVQHCQIRVALILEECRNTVADALQKVNPQSSTRTNVSYGRNQALRLSEIAVQRIEPTSQKASRDTAEHSKVTFQKSMASFTYAELNVLRPGAVFLCSLGGDRSTLGVVVSGNRELVESTRSFAMFFFREMDLTPHMRVTLIYVTQLVTQYRCFEALTTNYKIHFLSHLLGYPPDVPTHIRFGKQRVSFSQSSNTSDDSDDDAVLLNVAKPTNHRRIINGSSAIDPISEYFHVPILNTAQDEAAQTFLTSKPNTITIVQGPPGTGKTTLLVAILCRYCMESLKAEENGSAKRRRILVSAPTNKAVSLLATRFQKALKEEACNVNVILVGDADKLFSDEGGGANRKRHSGSHNPATKKKPPGTEPMLKSIFLYSWMSTIIEGYTRIRNYCVPTPYSGHDTIATLVPLAKLLRQRLTRRLLHLPDTLVRRMDEIVDGLESRLSSTNRAPLSAMVRQTEQQIKELKGMAGEMVLDQLMQSAHVIFCTLASAGGGVLKKTARIDDLIVDEAAAATEPELYIPFHLEPQRLLVVGDPLQLPATVVSQRAKDLGLAKSLHERLMFDCNYDHVMLNVQYRMHSNISAFPSETFYKGKIGNGPNVTSPDYGKGAILLNRQPYAFLQVDGREEQMAGGSYHNRTEAETIVELISTLHQLTEPTLSDKWCGTDRIRVITFYQAQVACIEQCLNERGLGNSVVVATVDSSQGCEADIVLISFVRSQRDGSDVCDEWSGSSNTARISSAGFLTDDRRMNVALTRAKYQLICVGNVRNFHRLPNAPTLHLLAKDAEDRGIVCMPPPEGFSGFSEMQTLHPAFKKFRRSWNND